MGVIHTHTHLYLHLHYHCQSWLPDPIQGVSQQEATRQMDPLAAGTPSKPIDEYP